MDKRDQELLAKQLVAVFLVGIGIGDILSKSKQAKTNYAAMVSRIAEAPP
jgi:hypothetical protein